MSDVTAGPHDSDLSAVAWRKSSYSGAESNCVETVAVPGGLAVRDSKNVTATPLRFTPAEWSAFRQALTTGEL